LKHGQGPSKGVFVEELEAAQGDGGAAARPVFHILDAEKVLAQFFVVDLIRRFAIMLGELSDGPDIHLLSASRHAASGRKDSYSIFFTPSTKLPLALEPREKRSHPSGSPVMKNGKIAPGLPKSNDQNRSPVRRWIRRGFIAWAIISTLWLLNSYRTQDVAHTLLANDVKVIVQSSQDALAFLPTSAVPRSGLLFVVGAGVAPDAYAPLLRPIAEQGYAVFVVKLPYRIAPLEQHKKTAVSRARAILEGNETVSSWVIAGHSLGGALVCRIAGDGPGMVTAMVLIGTSHPKTIDLSHSRIPITKVYASNDGIATVEMINATKHLLPRDTRWIEIEGGNHSQFAHYGHQLFDGSPTIAREQQQDMTRAALLDALEHTR
jgi:dienelactone hydrolase